MSFLSQNGGEKCFFVFFVCLGFSAIPDPKGFDASCVGLVSTETLGVLGATKDKL